MTPIDMHIERLRRLVLAKATTLDGMAECAISFGDQELAEKICQRAEGLRRIMPRLAALNNAPPTKGGTGHSHNPDHEEVAMREVYLIALEDLNRLENNRLKDPEKIVLMRKIVQKVRTLYGHTLQET